MYRKLDVLYLAIFLYVPLCGLSENVRRARPLVVTKIGTIRGLRSKYGYNKFLGVPYGIVPSNPFGLSHPHPGFKETYDAIDDSTKCPHIDAGKPIGEIDCLKMNIYVPNKDGEGKLPVMVWIHGGGFVEGYAAKESANPFSLIRHGVIVIGINYRLGVYGFLCLDIPEVPGNQGLKDQVLALRWIKDNIEAFGGDPNKITVFGNSAGGFSTNLHLYSEYEPLFNNAIIQSGPASSIWLTDGLERNIPFIVAAGLGHHTSNVYEALLYLSTVDPRILVKIAFETNVTNTAGFNQYVTKACIERKFAGVENFLTKAPRDSLPHKAKSVSIIIGHNNNESAFQFDSIGSDTIYDFNFGFDLKELGNEFLEIVRQYYFGDKEISDETKWELVEFLSDLLFGHATQREVRKLLESGAKNVFQYIFSYSGGRNYQKKQLNVNVTGATHGDEIGYLFDLDIFTGENTPEDQLMIDSITTLWTNFAKYSNPTPEKTEPIYVKWKPVTNSTQPYLDINTDLVLKNRPFQKNMAFWDLVYNMYKRYVKNKKKTPNKGSNEFNFSVNDSRYNFTVSKQLSIDDINNIDRVFENFAQLAEAVFKFGAD